MHCPTIQNVTFWRATRCGWWIFEIFFKKMEKTPFLGAKCTNLVTLAETRFQCYQMTALPDMNIFCQILVIFGFFLNFLSNFWQTTSGSSPKYDILDGWQKHVWYVLCISPTLSPLSLLLLPTFMIFYVVHFEYKRVLLYFHSGLKNLKKYLGQLIWFCFKCQHQV